MADNAVGIFSNPAEADYTGKIITRIRLSIQVAARKDRENENTMSEVWNKVYKSDKAFFGQEASNFAPLCFNHMKMNNVMRILELGAGHGRDTTFFGSNGIEVEAVDYSLVANEILDKITRDKRLPIKPRIFDVKRALPFPDGYFDAVYSHMLLNMRFSLDQLHFMFSEIRRVLTPTGLNFFSVRNHNDKSSGEGVKINKGIYDINGFQVRFFPEKEIQDLMKALKYSGLEKNMKNQSLFILYSARKFE